MVDSDIDSNMCPDAENDWHDDIPSLIADSDIDSYICSDAENDSLILFDDSSPFAF